MGKQDIIRAKLETKVFGAIGKTVTLNSISSPTYNERGEEESNISSTSSITIVPYNIVDARQEYQPFGDIEEGEMDAAVPYTVSIKIDDTLDIESETWVVKNVELNYLPENVVTIVRLAKLQN